MESLEDRALLSVTPFEYAEIRALYPAFALPENRAEVNVIDLAAATTSAQVQAALDAAKATPQDDLIVWRTTAEGGARFDKTLTVDFDASVSGSLTIVSYGDGVYVYYATTTFTGGAISGNTSPSGGVGVSGTATATLTDVAITGNVASSYGGVYSEGTAFFANVLNAGNSGSYGGAFYGEAGTATFANATLAGNSTTQNGGGIYAYSDATTLCNTIVAQNSSNDVKLASKASIAGYNSLSSFTAWNAGKNNYVYEASQPLFKDAANGDYTLAENSRALN